MHQRARTPTTSCCTRGKIGSVDVEDEASRRTMVANQIKKERTEVMPTANPDPPETGGVEAMRTSKGNLPRNAGTVARKATGRAVLEKTCRVGENRLWIWF